MLRTTSALLLALLSTLFTAGCDQQDAGIIWYDDGLAACFTDNDGGKTVEVPCDQEGIIWYDDEFDACFIILSNGVKGEVPCEEDAAKGVLEDAP
jgi:hypothetical protein